MPHWKALASHRLLQFVALGGFLFLVMPAGDRDDTSIALDRGDVRAVADLAAHRAGHLAADDARDGAVTTELVEDEIAVREALRLGLDRSDNIVRQRLIQKVLFLAEDLGGAWKPPADAELRAYFARTAQRWSRPDVLRVAQVYFHDASAADAARAQLPADPTETALAQLGEALPVPRILAGTADALASQLGPDLAAAVVRLPEGTWSAPIAGKLGYHVVRVLERRPGGAARFEDVRDAVRLAFVAERKQRAVEAYFARAADRYRITVGGEPYAYHPSGRVASATAGE